MNRLREILIEKLRKLPTGNYMVRVFIEHSEGGSRATVYTPDKTIEVLVPESGELEIRESRGIPVLPAVFPALGAA